MSMYFKLAAISTLLIFSFFDQGGSYKSPKGNGKGTVEAYKQPPCYVEPEEVYACQSSGGRFDYYWCKCELYYPPV